MHVVDRYLPEPFTFAIVMTLVALALVLAVTTATPVEAMAAWGDGLAALLPFITQMSLMVLLAFALSRLGPVPRLLNKLAGLPRSARGAYLMTTLTTGLISLVSWPLGLILGGLLARAVARSARARGIAVHYPLLAGGAFGGFVVWHMGYSASAPLFVATPGNAMEAQMGGLIPVAETIFAPWNLIIAAVTLALVAVTTMLLHPREDRVEPLAAEDMDPAPAAAPTRAPGLADTLERSRLLTLILGLLLGGFLLHWFFGRGGQLDLNVVNWTFLTAALLLARSARDFTTAVNEGGRAVVPILIQYPLYGGIMGLMLGTGFVTTITPAVAQFATETTLPVVAFLLGGLINLFIPSGGAQWAVQGPAFVAAAQELGTDLPLIVMGVAYGDQWTNIIHPFTVIPLLIMTGLKANQVLAYSSVLFLVAGVSLGLGLWVAAL